MQIVFGILLMFIVAASGSLSQDHVVCRFDQMNPCYVAVGQRLYLQMPLEDNFNLQATSIILRYRAGSPSSPPPRWQFVTDNKTMILTSAERSDSGIYTITTFESGEEKGSYTLQVNIEARVSSVSLSYSCLLSEVRKVFCSAEGDNLRFSWTSDLIIGLENDNKTLILNKTHNEKVICHVKNHVSHEQNSIKLLECTFDVGLTILSSICAVLIVLVVLVFCVYKRRQALRKKQAPPQDGKELVNTEVTNSARNKTETRPTPAHDSVENGTVVTSNQKKKEDDVQYGELVFNTPAQKKRKIPKVEEECVYSGVKHSQ